MGCWGDDWDRAIKEPKTTFNSNPIERCQDLAAQKGNTVFGLQYGKSCYTAADAELTYKKHGPKTNCKDGVGGFWALDVYKIVPCTQGITICCMEEKIFETKIPDD